MIKTLQSSLDNFLNYPHIIQRRDGRFIVKTSENMILKGQVTVNGITCTDTEREVKAGDYVRFGIIRYGNKDGYIVI